MAKTGSWMAANPVPSLIGANMLSSALAKEPEDPERARQKRSNIAGVGYGGAGKPIGGGIGLVRQAQRNDLRTSTV